MTASRPESDRGNAPPALSFTDSGQTLVCDALAGNHFRTTLTGHRTMFAPVGAADNQRLVFEVTQDATGSRKMFFSTDFVFGSDLTGAVLSTAAGATDYIGVIYNAVANEFRVVSFLKGF